MVISVGGVALAKSQLVPQPTVYAPVPFSCIKITPLCPVVTPVGFAIVIVAPSVRLKLFPCEKSNVVVAVVLPSPTILLAALPFR